jgi:hypothetical protein
VQSLPAILARHPLERDDADSVDTTASGGLVTEKANAAAVAAAAVAAAAAASALPVLNAVQASAPSSSFLVGSPAQLLVKFCVRA